MEVFSIIASREKVKVGIILGIFLILAYSPIIFLDQSYYQLPAIPISENDSKDILFATTGDVHGIFSSY